VNLKDYDTELHPVTSELHYDVQFAGVDITLLQDHMEFLYADLTGTHTHCTAWGLYNNIISIMD